MPNKQLRKHLKPTLGSRYRFWKNKRKLGQCGEGTFFEPEVHLMRYPKNIFLGSHMVLKSGARLCACNEKATIRIGNNTTVGYHTYMFASAESKLLELYDCSFRLPRRQ